MKAAFKESPSDDPRHGGLGREFALQISGLANNSESRDEFFRVLLTEILSTTGGVGAIVSDLREGCFQRISTVGHWTGDELNSLHDQGRRLTLEQQRPRWIRVADKLNGQDEASAADNLILMIPIGKPNSTFGIIELRLSSDTSPEKLREYATGILKLNGFVETFLTRDKVRRLTSDLHRRSSELEFAAAIHAGSDLRSVAFAIVNEARRILECRRVTLLTPSRYGFRVTAVSDCDQFDSRSRVIKSLAELANLVAATGMPLIHGAEPATLSPEIDACLASYIDLSHSRNIQVMPLHETRPIQSWESKERSRPVGILVFESSAALKESEANRDDYEAVVRHASLALVGISRQQDIFLFSLWSALGKATARLKAKTRRFRFACFAAVAAVIALASLETTLTVHAIGCCRPVVCRNVFAPQDAIVDELNVRHGDHVEIGAPLLTLRSVELEVTLNEAQGRRSTLAEEVDAVERILFDEQRKLGVEERVRLAGKQAELTHELQSIQDRIRLLESRRDRLALVSPIRGEITTWDVERLLCDRPVRAGQALLSIGDLKSDWELELFLPDRYLGHVMRAQDLNHTTQVVFRLTSDPSREYLGTVKQIDEVAELHKDYGNSIRVLVSVDTSSIPNLKPGTAVTAKIECDRCSTFYAWTHDFIDFLRTRVLFRLT